MPEAFFIILADRTMVILVNRSNTSPTRSAIFTLKSFDFFYAVPSNFCFFVISWSHFMPLVSFYTPWKHKIS